VMLMAVLLAAVLPTVSAPMAQELRSHPALALLWGFVAFACIPIAALLMLITIIGIQLALLTILLFCALLLVGQAVTAASIADLALRRFKSDAASSTAWRAGAAILAAVALALLARIPLIGWLVAFAAILLGIGVIATCAFRRPVAAAPAS
jgi:hypothetical protein